MKYEVVLPKEYIRRVLHIGLMVTTVLGLAVLGRVVSPVGEDGKPAPLSPRLADVTAYQRDARRWAGDLQEVQAGLDALLANPAGDLLAQDTQCNTLHERLISLQSEVDGTRVPPTLETLHTGVQDSVTATLNAAQAVTTWISEPTQENYVSAGNALHTAKDSLTHVDQNPWIVRP